MKIEFVYLSDFSAFAFITEAAHSSLFIVVTRSLVPRIHFSHEKTLRGFSWRVLEFRSFAYELLILGTLPRHIPFIGANKAFHVFLLDYLTIFILILVMCQ